PRRGAARAADRALQLREDPLLGAVRVLADSAVELLEQPALLVVEVARHEDVDQDAVVAAPEALENRHPPSAQDDDLSRLRPRLQRDLLVALERRHGDSRAEGGLGHRQVDGGKDGVALPDEARIRPYAPADAHVAG